MNGVRTPSMAARGLPAPERAVGAPERAVGAQARSLLAAVLLAAPGALLVTPAALHAAEEVAPLRPVSIDADHMSLRRKTSEAVFTGKVVVLRDGYRLTCRRLTVTYGAGHRVRTLVAEGAVRVVEADRVVTAERASFDNAREVLTLTGDPVLTQGANVIRGERVTFDLTTDEVEVEQVRARVKVGDVVEGGRSAQ